MLLNHTKILAKTALLCALSVILCILGTVVSVNTLFFTALAAYLLGYTVNRYGLRYGAALLAACACLDVFLNPDKFHWVYYLFLGGYIFLSECIYKKVNRFGEERKRMRLQFFFNWILFNAMYVPCMLLMIRLFTDFSLPGEVPKDSLFGIGIMWAAGQIFWFIFDRAYRFFFCFIKDRKIQV